MRRRQRRDDRQDFKKGKSYSSAEVVCKMPSAEDKATLNGFLVQDGCGGDGITVDLVGYVKKIFLLPISG